MSEYDGTIVKVPRDDEGWPALELRDDEGDIASAVKVNGTGALHVYMSRQHAYTLADVEALAWVFTALAAQMKKREVEWL